MHTCIDDCMYVRRVELSRDTVCSCLNGTDPNKLASPHGLYTDCTDCIDCIDCIDGVDGGTRFSRTRNSAVEKS